MISFSGAHFPKEVFYSQYFSMSGMASPIVIDVVK